MEAGGGRTKKRETPPCGERADAASFGVGLGIKKKMRINFVTASQPPSFLISCNI